MQDRTIVAARTKVGSDPLLLVDRSRAGVAVVTMNRPEQRNALSLDMIDRLHARFTRLASDATVSAVVLAANGPVFSSGHDLKELTAHRADADKGLAFYTEAMTRCSAMMQAIVACPKPVIAAVQGTATAAGCQLVATCDLAVAVERSQVLHPRRQHRPLLLDADGGAVAQRRPQARDGDAAVGRHAVGSGRGRLRPHQQGRAGGASAARGAELSRQDRRQVAAHRRHGQGRLLRAGRDAAERSLCLCGAR